MKKIAIIAFCILYNFLSYAAEEDFKNIFTDFQEDINRAISSYDNILANGIPGCYCCVAIKKTWGTKLATRVEKRIENLNKLRTEFNEITLENYAEQIKTFKEFVKTTKTDAQHRYKYLRKHEYLAAIENLGSATKENCEMSFNLLNIVAPEGEIDTKEECIKVIKKSNKKKSSKEYFKTKIEKLYFWSQQLQKNLKLLLKSANH